MCSLNAEGYVGGLLCHHDTILANISLKVGGQVIDSAVGPLHNQSSQLGVLIGSKSGYRYGCNVFISSVRPAATQQRWILAALRPLVGPDVTSRYDKEQKHGRVKLHAYGLQGVPKLSQQNTEKASVGSACVCWAFACWSIASQQHSGFADMHKCNTRV